MRAIQLCAELRGRLPEIAQSVVCIGRDSDFKDTSKREVNVFRILRIEVDHTDQEICVFGEFPDGDDMPEWPAVREFLGEVGPLASDNPDYAVVVSVELDIEIDGDSFSRFDLPVEAIAGTNSPPLVFLVARGFEQLAWEPD